MECAEFCEGIGEARWLIRGNAHPSKNRFDSITEDVCWKGLVLTFATLFARFTLMGGYVIADYLPGAFGCLL